MATTISLSSELINSLNLSPLQTLIENLMQEQTLVKHEQQLRFEISWSADDNDPRELSEIPEIRLWFIRADTLYPWLPFFLDWQAKELTRYVAMLVPHQFHPIDGIQFNPEALEIFLMHKIFTLTDWLHQQGLPSKSRLMSMSQLLGYELDPAFFDWVEENRV